MKRAIGLMSLTALVATIAYAQVGRPPASAGASSDLAHYPGFGHNPDGDVRAFVADEAKRQQKIFACMKAAGFDYHPEVAAVVRADSAGAARSKRPPSKNAVYVAGLSGDRLVQYNTTLYGVPDPNSETALWDPNSGTGGGCWGEALRAVPGVFAASRELTNEYVAMRREANDDPEVKAAEQQWSTCMRQAGHDFATISEFVGVQSNNGEARGREKISAELLGPMKAKSDECLATAKFADVAGAARVRAENRFVARNKATLDTKRYAP